MVIPIVALVVMAILSIAADALLEFYSKEK